MIVAILQARMSSTRLPGKVLKPLAGAPSLVRQLERLERAKGLVKLIVATSINREDDAIAETCAARGTACYRGSLENVLDRYYQAALAQAPLPDHIMRLTADCPLADWRLIDRLVDIHLEGNYDYSSNVAPRRYPKGLDAEIFTLPALTEAWNRATTEYQREHVTPYFYQPAACDTFRRGSESHVADWSCLRWTLDTAEDYSMISEVYQALFLRNPEFSTTEIMEFLLENPEVAALNADDEALGLYKRLRESRERSPAE